MKSLVLTLFCTVVLFNVGYGQSKQQEKENLKQLQSKFETTQDLNLIVAAKRDSAFKSCKSKAAFEVMMCNYYMNLRSRALRDKILDKERIYTDSVLHYYQNAIDACSDCAIKYRFTRLEFLDKLKDKTLYNSEVASLKLLGYKPPAKIRSGFSFGVSSQFGNNNWIGVNAAFVEDYLPNYFSKDYNAWGYKASSMTIEILKNTQQNAWDVSFSVLKLTAPIHIDVMKFGYQRFSSENKIYWYYRPEIGIGWNVLSAGYAYNIYFKKPNSLLPERHLFFLRLSYPLIKFRSE